MRPPRRRRHDHRDERDRRQEDDVDLGVAEDPEEVLPEQRVAAAARIEERPAEGALELEQHRAGDERRKREEHHERRHEHVPGVERHQVEPHARRPAAQHADDQLHGGGDRRDFDEREAEQPDVGADVGLIAAGERRVHEPAALAARRRRRASRRGTVPPIAKAQNPNADSRGNGSSRAPSICGRNRIETASKIGIANRNIITEPCTREDLVVAIGREEVVARARASCSRISSARTPPKRKKTSVRAMYQRPTTVLLTADQ